MLPLTIAIIAQNEEQNLRKLLPLIQGLAKEIIVVDGQSIDTTVELCRAAGAKVFIEEWKGHVAQKQSALSKCSEAWILFLDCDELPDAELLKSVRNTVGHNIPGAFCVQRKTVYLGRVMQHAWQPDVHLRLVHRSLEPRIVSVNGHDALQSSATTSSKLQGWLMHYSYRDIAHHYEKTLLYARMGADEYARQGRTFHLLQLLVNPAIAFLKMAILRHGLLDGIPGLLACCSTWLHVFLKYAMLWERQRSTKKSSI